MYPEHLVKNKRFVEYPQQTVRICPILDGLCSSPSAGVAVQQESNNIFRKMAPMTKPLTLAAR